VKKKQDTHNLSTHQVFIRLPKIGELGIGSGSTGDKGCTLVATGSGEDIPRWGGVYKYTEQD